MNIGDKAHQPTRVKSPVHTGDMFTVRRARRLDSQDSLYSRRFSDSETELQATGHQTGNEFNRRRSIVSKVLPPILTESSEFVPRASSDTKLVIDAYAEYKDDSVQKVTCVTSTKHGLEDDAVQSPVRVTVANHHPFLQTHGNIPGIDSHVTIKHPFLIENGTTPTIKKAFQSMPSDKASNISDDTVIPDDRTCCNSSNISIRIPSATEDMSDSEYDISTFPPVRKDDIKRHSELNRQAVKNSRKTPNAYQDYLQKLQVQKRLLVKPKLHEPKNIKRKNKKLQFKTRHKDAREDLIEEKPDTPAKPKSGVIKPMKVIQSFRYSRAITEYYKGQMDSKHSITSSIDGDTSYNDECDKVENGWLVKSLGPQVLNLYARTLPSCNPIELRLRRQHARQRAMENGRFSKRSSAISNGSRLSRSHDSFTDQGYDSIQSNRFNGNEMQLSSSQTTGQPSKGRFLPNISEVYTEKDQTMSAVSGSTNPQKATLVLNLPLLTSDA